MGEGWWRTSSVRLACVSAGALALAILVSAGGCSGDKPGMGGEFGGPDTGLPPTCSTLETGCPCDVIGKVANCGKVTQTVGSYVTCSMGTMTCDGSKWGECAGDRIVVKSLPGQTLTAGGIHVNAIQVACSNVCDPNDCQSTAADPASDVDGSGIKLTDSGGVAIKPVTYIDGGDGGDGSTCRGLQCQVPFCGATGTTTISGTVYDPAGLNPLYNAYVFIPVDPTAALPAFTDGATCDTCAGATSINAVAVAQTGPDGKFTLTDVPAGTNIPIVIQMGKWRRKTTIPSVLPCAGNPLGATNTRLPRNQFDGDGNKADIPKMALVSGNADPFECMLLKAGLDPAEFGSTTKNATRRIHYYDSPSSAGSSIDSAYGDVVSASGLWSDVNNLKKYDVVLLPCEGGEYDKGTTAYANVISYANLGGRVFTTHYGYVWMLYPTAWRTTASWLAAGHALNATQDPLNATIVQTGFPKGQAFAQWLVNVGASAAPGGTIGLKEARQDLTTVGASSQSWMTATNTNNSTAFSPHLTFNTPYGAAAANQCGRVVFSDFHVSSAAQVSGTSCTVNSDCGFTATCTPAVMGSCTNETCRKASDCADIASSCSGSRGTCVAKSCTANSQCPSNSCVLGKCRCSNNSQCQGNCVANVCELGKECDADGSCDSAETCSGALDGTCTKNCTTNSDCANGAYCFQGTCKGCYTSNDCPGSTTCTGGSPSSCSTSSGAFPYECKQGPLSAQEKALEFMLFDLTACVSPDSAPPPPPPTPVTIYPPVSFAQTYEATCATGKRPVWRELDWRATIPTTPSGANINFGLRTAATSAGLNTAPTIQLANATTSTPNPSTNWDIGIIDSGSSGAFYTAKVRSEQFLSVIITLNPSTDQSASPSLDAWKIQYDCVDAE